MVQININAIPESDMNVMARGLLTTITAFYNDSDNMRRFQEWERQQENKKRINNETE